LGSLYGVGVSERVGVVGVVEEECVVRLL
jgi:hypothetical protein